MTRSVRLRAIGRDLKTRIGGDEISCRVRDIQAHADFQIRIGLRVDVQAREVGAPRDGLPGWLVRSAMFHLPLAFRGRRHARDRRGSFCKTYECEEESYPHA